MSNEQTIQGVPLTEPSEFEETPLETEEPEEKAEETEKAAEDGTKAEGTEDETGEDGGGESGVEPESKTYTLKIYGQEREVTEAQLIEHAQKGLAAGKKFEEANQKVQQAMTVINALVDAEDPMGVFEDILTHRFGGDRQRAREKVQEVNARFLQRIVDEEQMDPRARDIMRREREIRAREREQQKQYQLSQQQRQQQLVEAITSRLKESDVPVDQFTVGRAAYYLQEAVQAGQNMGFDEAAKKVKEEYEAYLLRHVESLPEDQLERKLPQAAKRLSEARAKKVRESQATKMGQASAKPTTAPTRRSKQKRQTFKTWDAWRRARNEGGL